jgi:hypothetical protein
MQTKIAEAAGGLRARGSCYELPRAALLLLLALWIALPAAAHVGSPDVYYEGDAGPYHLFVVVRVPQALWHCGWRVAKRNEFPLLR